MDQLPVAGAAHFPVNEAEILCFPALRFSVGSEAKWARAAEQNGSANKKGG